MVWDPTYAESRAKCDLTHSEMLKQMETAA